MTLDTIRAEANKARAVSMKHGNEISTGEFGDFPNRGGCGPLSEFLGKWLQDKGVLNLKYVSGTRNDNKAHAWLEYKGYIIDLAGDQFPGFDIPVYIDTDRSFHDTFNDLKRTDLPVESCWWEEISKFYQFMKAA